MHGLISVGLQRLQTFAHADGRFSYWCGGPADQGVTRKVAHRLLALRGLGYEQAEAMLAKTREALLKAKVKDNQLFPLDPAFRDKIHSALDAAALYFATESAASKEEALAFLRNTAVRTDSSVHWPAGDAWGGTLETTCDATRVLYRAGDALYKAGFAYVGRRLIDGRLYSTADTRALVELLATLQTKGRRAKVDGVEQTISQPVFGKSVLALEDGVVARLDQTEELDYLQPRANFQFTVGVAKQHLTVGERTQIHVHLRQASRVPLARVYLPANLALLKGGANAQEAHEPVIGETLVLDAVAVRRGRARLYVTVYDMYDADQVGVAPPVTVTVE